jgi:hypothetical protein
MNQKGQVKRRQSRRRETIFGKIPVCGGDRAQQHCICHANQDEVQFK